MKSEGEVAAEVQFTFIRKVNVRVLLLQRTLDFLLLKTQDIGQSPESLALKVT
jgi:hypothetical protein